MSNLSPAGRKKMAVYALLLLLDISVIALACCVNVFQEFFFMADLFPLGLSIATFIILFSLVIFDIVCANSFLSHPAFEIGTFSVLSLFWLAFNIFSTVRWRNIPMNCSSIPFGLPDDRVWCQEVQALKTLVWILFVSFLLTTGFLSRYVIRHHVAGNRQIWSTPISRFHLDKKANLMHHSAFRRATMPDYFGTAGTYVPPAQTWQKFEG